MSEDTKTVDRVAFDPKFTGDFRYYDGDNNSIAHIDVVLDGHAAWLNNLWVKPAYRRKGYASRLLVNAVRMFGHLNIYLKAEPYTDRPASLEELKAFYEKFGFRETVVPNVMHRVPFGRDI